jgi:CheY-like chemotaxis protein
VAWRRGLRAAIGHHPDLIITDFQMPIMNGLELVRTLCTQGETLPIPLLSSDPDIGKAALAPSASAFLPKPFPLPALRALLRSLLFEGEATQVLGR